MRNLERNLLAEFYSRLATLAFERNQWELAADYLHQANAVLVSARMANEVYK